MAPEVRATSVIVDDSVQNVWTESFARAITTTTSCASSDLAGLSAVHILPLAAILLKWILVSNSGRSFSSEYLDLSLLFAVGSFLWMNSDRRFLLWY